MSGSHPPDDGPSGERGGSSTRRPRSRRVSSPRLVATVAGAALVVAGVASSGCGGGSRDEEVLDALRGTVEALEAGDWEELWEMSAPESRRELLKLHRRLHRALDAVDRVYPEEERSKARAAVGRDLVENIPPDAEDAGPRLLERLLEPEAMELDSHTYDAIDAADTTIDDDEAVIHTAAGEVFTFQHTDAGWRSKLVMDVLQQSSEVAELRDNARAVLDSLEEQEQAWRTSRDPRQPQGAYNLARHALSSDPPDGATLYALLDEPAREALKRALEIARDLQRKLQQRTDRSEREAAYEEHGIALHADAGSAQALYEAWAKQSDFVAPAPEAGPPAEAETGSDDDRATIATKQGERIPVVRDDEGYWHLAEQAETIRKELVAPVRKQLEEL